MKLSTQDKYRLITGDLYIKVPSAYLQHLKPAEALCLAYLAYRGQKDGELWFYCSNKELQSCVNLTRSQLERSLKKLVDLKLIKWKMIGNPAKRSIRLNLDKLIGLITSENGVPRVLKNKEARVLKNKEALLFPKGNNKIITVAKENCDGVSGGFFKNKVSPNKQRSFQFAKQLHQALAQKNKVKRKPNLTKWASELLKLYEIDHVCFDDIEFVLNWYCAEIGKQYIPKIYSAHSFRNRFDDLYGKAKESSTSQDLEISKEVRKINERLLKLDWGSKASMDIPLAVQTTHSAMTQAIRAFKHHVDTQHSKKAKETRILSFCSYLLEQIGNPSCFVEAYFTGVFQKVKQWKEWNGNITFYAITDIYNKHLQEYGQSVGQEWDHDPTLWNQLIERIYANTEEKRI